MSKGSMTEESVKIQRTKVLDWKHRAAPFATPWIIMVAVFVLSLITHATCNGPVALVFMTLMIPGLTWVTWSTWERRHQHARTEATAFTAGFSFWLVMATAIGPLAVPMLYAYVFGGAFLCLSWNIRYAGITPTNKHDAVTNERVDPLSLIKGLKGVVTKKAKIKGDAAQPVAEIILNHPGGRVTTDDVKRRTGNIAAAYSVDRTAVHVSDVDGRNDQSKVTVRMSDPTQNVVRWQGVSAPGQSITAAPLRTGVREDGQPSTHWITGDDDDSRAASATLYTGMTGSGKTRAYILSMLEMVSRTDCAVPIVADPEKFLLSFGMIMDYIPCAADGPQQTGQLVSNLPEAMRYRARLLGSLGYEQWVPECYTRHGIALQPIHIEEAGGYLSNSPDFNKAIMLCRALGMPLSISLQVAVYRQLQREARSQFGNSLAFGVKELRDAAFALTDATMQAGADPSRWANNEPGRFYAETTGTPSDQWPLKHRAFKISRDEIIASFEASRDAGIAQCDPGTFSLLSRGIERPSRMIVPVPDWGPVDVTPEADTVTMPRPTFEMIKGDGQPVEDDRPDTASARDLIDGRIDELEASGVTECTAADFEDLVQALGYDRTWIYRELPRPVSEGRLARLPGKGARYRIIPKAVSEEM